MRREMFMAIHLYSHSFIHVERKHLLNICKKRRPGLIFLFSKSLDALRTGVWVQNRKIFTLQYRFGSHSARVSFISRRSLVWSGCVYFHSQFLSIDTAIMGNILQRNSVVDGDVKTPPMAALTSAEVDIIKETWKIPSANVSAETCNKEWRKCFHSLPCFSIVDVRLSWADFLHLPRAVPRKSTKVLGFQRRSTRQSQSEFQFASITIKNDNSNCV
jgi:hypothetical protein